MLVRFRKLDQDGNGHIDVEEFMSVAHIAKNPVAARVISVLDEDEGGTVDFPEFVRVRLYEKLGSMGVACVAGAMGWQCQPMALENDSENEILFVLY